MQVILGLIIALATAGSTLILVEDLHWMDASTLELVRRLVRVRTAIPLLGLLTVRSDSDTGLGTARPLQTIDLLPFDRVQTEALVRHVARGKALPPELVRRIFARSDGVPLFIEELTRSVLDSGLLHEGEAAWESVGPVLPPELIPATVDASLTSRVDGLGASRATAQLSATIGREFTFSLLRIVSERSEATLRDDLRRMITAGLASSVDGETFVFKHALVCDAAYNSLLRSTRQANHARIAAALQKHFQSTVFDRPDLVAHHLTCAGQDEDAIAVWEAAGRQALARTATHEAAEHLQRAIACLGRLSMTPERQNLELELRILLAPLLMAVYGWGAIEVQEVCERALALAQELRRFDRLYPPLWGLWTVRFLRGDMRPALKAAELALETARASSGRTLEVTGHEAMAYTLVYQGEFDAALREANDGLALFDVEQERHLVALFGLSPTVGLSAARGHALWMLGRVAEAEEQWENMLELARALQHPPSLATALGPTLHGHGLGDFHADRLDRVAKVADELLSLAKEEDFFLWSAVATMYRGLVGLFAGDEQSNAEVREGYELFKQTGARLTLVMMNALWAEGLLRLGDDREASRRLDAAENEMKIRGEGLFTPEIWRLRGRLLARQGEFLAAEAAYRQSLARAGGQHAVSLELRAALDLYEALEADGRGEEGRRRLAGLLDQFTDTLDRPEPARAAAIVGGLLDTP